MNKLILSVIVAAFFSATSALACLPPPPNYFESNSISAILASDEVIEKLGRNSITAIRKHSFGKWEVEAGSKCSLTVVVEANQLTPDAPCGGPFTFNAVLVSEKNCSSK